MTKYDVIAMLKNQQGEQSLRQFAKVIGVTPAYLSDVYQERRNPGPSILKYLKLKKSVKVEYTPIKIN